MKRFVPFALTTAFAAALVVVGCTVNNTETNNNGNPDGGSSGQPDGAPPDDKDDGGTDGSTTAATEVVEAVGNDDFDTAQEVPANSLLKANMTDGETDYFKVTIPDGTQDGVLSFTMHETSADFTPKLAVHKGDKTEDYYDYAADSNTDPSHFSHHVTAGKTYFVLVSGGHSGVTVPYELTVKFTPVVDAFERNDSKDDAKDAPIGTPFDLVIFAGTDTNGGADVDFFKFDAPADKTKLRVKIENKTTGDEAMGYKFSLFDKDNNEGNYDYVSSGASYDDTVDLPAGGGLTYVSFERSDGAERSATASKVTLSLE